MLARAVTCRALRTLASRRPRTTAAAQTTTHDGPRRRAPSNRDRTPRFLLQLDQLADEQTGRSTLDATLAELAGQEDSPAVSDGIVKAQYLDAFVDVLGDPAHPPGILSRKLYRTSRSIMFGQRVPSNEAKASQLSRFGRALLSRPDRFDGPSETGTKTVVDLVEDLVDCLFRVNHPFAISEAAHLLEVILGHSPTAISDEALVFALRSLAGQRQTGTVHRLVTMIPLEQRTLGHYKACLTVLARSSVDEATRRAMMGFWDELESHSTVVPDNEAFHLYLSLQAREGRVHEVEQAVGRMDRLGLLPDPKVDHFILQSLTVADSSPPSSSSTGPVSSVEANLILSRAELIGRDFRETLIKLEAAGVEFDEVTRNLIVRALLQTQPPSSPSEVKRLLRASLDGWSDRALVLADFNRFRQPLYTMLIKSMARVGDASDVAALQAESAREKKTARLLTNVVVGLADAGRSSHPWQDRLRPVDDFFVGRPSFTRAHLAAMEHAIRTMPVAAGDQEAATAQEAKIAVVRAAVAMADDPPG